MYRSDGLVTELKQECLKMSFKTIFWITQHDFCRQSVPNIRTYLLTYLLLLNFKIWCTNKLLKRFIYDGHIVTEKWTMCVYYCVYVWRDVECLAAVRFLLLSADAGGLMMTCGMVRKCLLPLADVLESAGTHVYLSTTRLHRAMMMMGSLTTELGTCQGRTATASLHCFILFDNG